MLTCGAVWQQQQQSVHLNVERELTECSTSVQMWANKMQYVGTNGREFAVFVNMHSRQQLASQ